MVTVFLFGGQHILLFLTSMKIIFRQDVFSSSDNNLPDCHDGPPVLCSPWEENHGVIHWHGEKDTGKAYFSENSVSTCVWTSYMIPDQYHMMEKLSWVQQSHTCEMWVQKKFEIIFAKGWGAETAAVCPIKQIQYLNEIGTYNQYWSREKSNNNLIGHWKRPSFVNLLVMLQSRLVFFHSALLKILRRT